MTRGERAPRTGSTGRPEARPARALTDKAVYLHAAHGKETKGRRGVQRPQTCSQRKPRQHAPCGRGSRQVEMQGARGKRSRKAVPRKRHTRPPLSHFLDTAADYLSKSEQA